MITDFVRLYLRGLYLLPPPKLRHRAVVTVPVPQVCCTGAIAIPRPHILMPSLTAAANGMDRQSLDFIGAVGVEAMKAAYIEQFGPRGLTGAPAAYAIVTVQSAVAGDVPGVRAAATDAS